MSVQPEQAYMSTINLTKLTPVIEFTFVQKHTIRNPQQWIIKGFPTVNLAVYTNWQGWMQNGNMYFCLLICNIALRTLSLSTLWNASDT